MIIEFNEVELRALETGIASITFQYKTVLEQIPEKESPFFKELLREYLDLVKLYEKIKEQ